MVLFSWATKSANAQTEHQPNIIFILADDLGYGDVKSFNPDGKIQTPFIDQLASEGIKFTNAHSSSSVCTPSRYSILTGRYPWRSSLQEGVLYGYDRPLIEPDRLTVAALLKVKGYYTACIGKWHLGLEWALKPGYDKIKTGFEVDYNQPVLNGPISRGFDYFFGISASLDMPPYVFIENDRTVGIPTTIKKFVREGPAEKDFEAVNVLPTLVDKAKKTITNGVAEKKPFFLYFALPSPHTPIVPDSNFLGKTGITQYGDYVAETDWAVGQIMQVLDSLKISKQTLLIFTSDNGFAPYVLNQFNVEESGHFPSYIFRGYKADIWEGGHRIPLVLRWPEVVQSPITNNDLISLTDFMATAADLVEFDLPDNAAVDSYSLLPFLTGKSKKTARKAIVYASIDGNFSIQVGKWKLEFCPGSGGWTAPNNKKAFKEGLPLVQLYNLESDISEKTNLEKRYPKRIKRLTKLMEDYIVKGRSTAGKTVENDSKIDLWKKGYIGNN